MAPDDPRHGTRRGYAIHRQDHEAVCDPCQRAAARYEQERQLDIMAGKSRMVDSTGSVRRLQALAAIGWPWRSLDIVPSGQLHQLTARKTLQRGTAERIAEVYDRLCMTPGPSRRAALRAAANGWATPLAWDDIDDPNEVPNGASVATITPIRDRTWDTADHRACPRCGVVREVYITPARGDLCRDCRQEVA